MRLIHYEVDFSQLTPDERSDAEEALDKFSYCGLAFKPGFKVAQFFADERSDINFVELPPACRPYRIP